MVQALESQPAAGATGYAGPAGNRRLGARPAENRRNRNGTSSTGVDIPNEKCIEIALTYIFGGYRISCHKGNACRTGINPDIRVKDLTDEQLITLA